VIYFHDGQMLFDSNTTWNKQEWGLDEVAGDFISKNLVRPFIIVAIWNTNLRHSEYFPQKAFEKLPPAFRDSLLTFANRNNETPLFSSKIQSDAYLSFIVTELKPFIDNQYSTLTDRENTFIAGSSMGGLISMYAVCEYPEVFGGAACLSTHWPGIFTLENNPIPTSFQDYLRNNIPEPKNHRWYFDHGTETIDKLYGPIQLEVDELFKEKGYTKENYLSLQFEGAEHSENAWRERIHKPLQFHLFTVHQKQH
jgi:enterochelin esterase-like enzyme